MGTDNYILAWSLNLKQTLENANNQVGKHIRLKVQIKDRGVYSKCLNSVSSQCARGKPSIARKPEDHPKSFKW